MGVHALAFIVALHSAEKAKEGSVFQQFAVGCAVMPFFGLTSALSGRD